MLAAKSNNPRNYIHKVKVNRISQLPFLLRALGTSVDHLPTVSSSTPFTMVCTPIYMWFLFTQTKPKYDNTKHFPQKLVFLLWTKKSELTICFENCVFPQNKRSIICSIIPPWGLLKLVFFFFCLPPWTLLLYCYWNQILTNWCSYFYRMDSSTWDCQIKGYTCF